jgi:hypothetical protein
MLVRVEGGRIYLAEVHIRARTFVGGSPWPGDRKRADVHRGGAPAPHGLPALQVRAGGRCKCWARHAPRVQHCQVAMEGKVWMPWRLQRQIARRPVCSPCVQHVVCATCKGIACAWKEDGPLKGGT